MMITNQRQYRITRRQLLELREAIKNFKLEDVAERVGSKLLAEAELSALNSEESVLSNQIREYDLLRSGQITHLKASSLEELPSILIRARIAQRLSQKKLAELVGLKEQQIQRYESNEYTTASLSRLREIADALKLSITENAELKPIPSTTNRIINGNMFPIEEMYKRGWFEGFSGSLTAALEEADNLIDDFLKNVKVRPSFGLHRKRVRSGSSIDQYALLAWECRVLSLAKKANLSKTYNPRTINDRWISDLVQLSRKSDGPVQAKKKLEEVGIALVVESHLVNTHLDGAGLMYGGSPVIGMTLRYDRTDNFWFVLFHELFHVIKHLNKKKLEAIFDDLDESDTDTIEHEADSLAGEALLPKEIWNHALARYVRSPESVIDLAEKLSINPAIVAGRIRHEANNYLILSDFVGQGEVRKHFPEAGFGI